MRLGTSTVTDSSAAGNDGTRHGALYIPFYVPGVFGGALPFFSPNKGYVNVPHDVTLNFGTGDFSLSIWMKKNFLLSGHEAIINKITSQPPPDGYGLFLRDQGALWFQDTRFTGPIIEHDLIKTLYEFENTVEEPTNPVMEPTEAWEGDALCEQDCFKVGSEYRMWYRAGMPQGIGYATSSDGITWDKDAGNPISFEPTIPDGQTSFPKVIRDGDNFYMFLMNSVDFKIYLFNVTDPTNPVVMNDGDAVLEPSQDWELTIIYNVSVAIVDGVWHMLYEGGSGYDPLAFRMGYTYSTLEEMNWTIHKSPTNPVIELAGNPELIYVPERNALLAIHGSLTTPHWSLMASYASLSSDLNLPASWQQGQILKISLLHETDPAVLVGYSDTYPIMISWIHNQINIHQMYTELSLTQLYDALIESVEFEPWVFLAITRESGVLKLYVNKELKETVAWTGNVTTTQPLVLGRNSYSAEDYFIGCTEYAAALIDEVRIDKGVAWTQEDIDSLYAGETINEDYMVLHFSFDEEPLYEDEDPEAQDYSSFWQNMLSAQKQNFGANSTSVTRYALRFHGRDSITGQMTREYEDMGAISMVVVNKNSARTAYTAGYYVRLDALGATGDVVREGDKIELTDGTVYRVASVQPQRAGNTILLWTCDLEELPFKEF